MINKENINKNLNDEEVEEIIKTNLKKSLIKYLYNEKNEHHLYINLALI